MFEEIDTLYSSECQSYDKLFVLNRWLNNPDNMFIVMPPPMRELFTLLDEELLIGDSQLRGSNWNSWRYYVSGICDVSIHFGTGAYSSEFSWDYGEVT